MRFKKWWISCLFVGLTCCISYAQQSFTFTNESAEVLIGVELFIDGQMSHVSDFNGNIHLDQPLSNDATITCKYLGYKDLNIAASTINQSPFSIVMLENPLEMDEIIVIGRTNEKIIEMPFQVERIDQATIAFTQAQTAADLLEKNGAVFIQKSQMGGGSPVLRGFEANKILLVIDGVKLNNAIYRSGHLQNAITVDHESLQATELIYGPGSLNYGSDALGGVIHFRTQDPKLNFTEKNSLIEGRLSTRFASANQEKRGHFHLNYGKRKWASYSSISWVDYSDLKAGGNFPERYPDYGKRLVFVQNDSIVTNPDPQLQVGTGYSQLDFLQKFKYQLNDAMNIKLNLQYSNSSDIPRYDALTETNNGTLAFAEWYYGPQKRLLIAPSFEWSADKKIFDKLQWIVSYQKIDEDRYSRGFQSPLLNVQLEDVDVLGSTLDFTKAYAENSKINYGIDFQYNQVESNSFDENINSGLRSNALTRYPSGGSTLGNWGVYVRNRTQLGSSLKWNKGVRLSGQFSSFKFSNNDPFDWPAHYDQGFTNNNTSFTWINSFSYHFGQQALIRFTTGSAFRSPNIDDMAKVRINGNEITIPNPELNPEKTINAELTGQLQNSLFEINLTAFYTSLRDAIIRTNSTLPNGDLIYTAGGIDYNVSTNINEDKAIVKGLSLLTNLSLANQWEAHFDISYTHGISIDAQELSQPLAHIPPLYGKASIKHSQALWSAMLAYRFNGAKSLDQYGGSTDNPEFATAEGALAWSTLNLYTELNLKNNLAFKFAVENIFDQHYRPFASGVSGAGRNFILGLSYEF